MASEAHNKRSGRESLSKRLGRKAGLIKARDQYTCVYCGALQAESPVPFHLDHITPRADGGLDVPENLVLACPACNCARRKLSLEAWQVFAQATRSVIFSAESIRKQAAKPLS